MAKKKASARTDDKVVVATKTIMEPPKPIHSIPEQDNSMFRRLGNWKSSTESVQNFPPSVAILNYHPKGEYMEYNNKGVKSLSDESETPGLTETDLNDMRRAAEVHRNVRKYAQSYIRPGMSMLDICQKLEKKTLELVGTNSDWSNYLQAGYGFPTGCSLNHVAAHYTPNNGDKTILQSGDICKLDFGVHVNGRIMDSAFTIAFDPIFDPLIQCTQDATNAGLREAGIDARLGEIGSIIQETIESFEFVDKSGKTIRIKPCKNLNGHSIEPYKIHGGQSVPIVAKSDFSNDKMIEGQCYAIETFATTGRGYVVEDGECSHYMMSQDATNAINGVPIRVKGARELLKAIDNQFSTLPFCRRWLDDIGQTRHLMPLRALVDYGLVNDYPPLVDVKGSFTSQMEHTLVLRRGVKEILTRGDDY